MTVTLRIGQRVRWQGHEAIVLAWTAGIGLGDFVGDPRPGWDMARIYVYGYRAYNERIGWEYWQPAEVRAVPVWEVEAA